MRGTMVARHTAAGAALTALILEVFQCNGRLLEAGDRLARDVGLTSARWQVLGALAHGPLTAAQIARNMGVKRQSVQRLVDVLAEEGVVRLEDNPHHLRAKLVRTTPAGQSKFARIGSIQAEWVNRLADGLPAAEIERAVALLREVQSRLRRPSRASSGRPRRSAPGR